MAPNSEAVWRQRQPLPFNLRARIHERAPRARRRVHRLRAIAEVEGHQCLIRIRPTSNEQHLLLVVRARLDRRRYATGKKVSDKELRELKIETDAFHGDWNYVVRPRTERS